MALGPRNEELRLLVALRQSISLKAMGCRFDRGMSGTVSLTVAHGSLGAWWYENGRFHYSAVAYTDPQYSVDTPQEAADITSYIVANGSLARDEAARRPASLW